MDTDQNFLSLSMRTNNDPPESSCPLPRRAKGKLSASARLGAMFTRAQRLIQTSETEHAHAILIQHYRLRKHAFSRW